MRLYLIYPLNSLVSILTVKESRWNRRRGWKLLTLMILAGNLSYWGNLRRAAEACASFKHRWATDMAS
jgi:hypothetical protein